MTRQHTLIIGLACILAAVVLTRLPINVMYIQTLTVLGTFAIFASRSTLPATIYGVLYGAAVLLLASTSQLFAISPSFVRIIVVVLLTGCISSVLLAQVLKKNGSQKSNTGH